MLTIDTLRAYGANVEEGLTRCMGMEGFYLGLVGKIRNDNHVRRLEESVRAGDLDSAFEAAHALKGVLANLALTPALNPVSEITEALRARREMDYEPLLLKVRTEWDRLTALLDA